MFYFQDAELKKLVIHRVGNRSLEQGYKLSESEIDIKELGDLPALLTTYFLKSFENIPTLQFHHPSDLDLNEVYHFAKKIFATPSTFLPMSQEIGRVLYQYSDHPKIKDGELYIAYFKKCSYDGQEVDAIGIFKSETKESFIKPEFDGENYYLGYDEGVNINKIDKGCIILNTNKDTGYLAMTIDNLTRGNEAQYWKDEFLKLRPTADNYYTTQNYLDVCKNFVTTQIDQEYKVETTDKIDLLNKTVNYFKQNDAFDEDHFLEEVFGDTEVINSFKTFKDEFAAERDWQLNDSFDISNQAVKKQARVFKSVLKLDKNFHIYIHGDKELIEKGYDAQMGMNYYKIYYEEET